MIKLGGIGTILIVFFIVWSLLAGDRSEQLERACRPVDWFGNMAISVVAVTYNDGVQATARGFEQIDYTCQYMLWRLFYESSYQKAVADGLIDPETGEAIVDKKTAVKAMRRDSGTEQTERPYPYPLVSHE